MLITVGLPRSPAKSKVSRRPWSGDAVNSLGRPSRSPASGQQRMSPASPSMASAAMAITATRRLLMLVSDSQLLRRRSRPSSPPRYSPGSVCHLGQHQRDDHPFSGAAEPGAPVHVKAC